jgi:hypothetical protein
VIQLQLLGLAVQAVLLGLGYSSSNGRNWNRDVYSVIWKRIFMEFHQVVRLFAQMMLT